MTISNFVNELRQRNILLFYFGGLNGIVFLACLGLYYWDDTMIMGLNAWIKPMKFALSIGIYTLTFGWLLHYLKDHRKRMVISWIVVFSMTVEMTIIFYQAYRGEQSHYNISSGFNAMLFSMMGMFIGINSVINLYTLILFFIPAQIILNDSKTIAWRMGLLFFFMGGLSGGWMISQMSHTVGALDGGPGLPLLNWSIVAGDIRAAHFITLHGLQAIPLFLFSIGNRFSNPKQAVIYFSIGYALICIVLHIMAWRGIPVGSL